MVYKTLRIPVASDIQQVYLLINSLLFALLLQHLAWVVIFLRAVQVLYVCKQSSSKPLRAHLH